ncbi:Rrf2 family transcriptional regulator [Pseudoalteromonas prydzensis]|uniref:Rrf2 family transcriptional regulator n=1 Tax=Pseudoalteromonas prydzensis TaxID=182141 RepID=UPI0007E513D9|nr:Rrf2 family transcriptional regulator [Pseudoalteromonas prydzensis]MBE0378185.1 hypothetical protein [Pseudoalteromonas prydzensis ACAM 620]
MRKDSRLSRVLHILAHLAVSKNAMTSTEIAKMLTTNPVVVRRTMGLLREYGYVQSSNGRSGGWVLARPLNEMTLLDIHQALGTTTLFTISLEDEHSSCPIEKSINAHLGDVLDDAESLILTRFGEITLDVLLKL